MRVHKRILSIFLFFGLLFSGCKNDLQKDQPELSFSEQLSGNELIGASCCNCGTNLNIHDGYEPGQDICNTCKESTPYKILEALKDCGRLSDNFLDNRAGATDIRGIFTEKDIDLKDTEILKTYYPEFFGWSDEGNPEENKSLTKNILINIRAHKRNLHFESKNFSNYIFRIGHAITTDVQYLNRDGVWIGASSQSSDVAQNTHLNVSKLNDDNLSTIKNFLLKIFNKTSFDDILDDKTQRNITINISFGNKFSVSENTSQNKSFEKITYTIEKIDDGIIQISKQINNIYTNEYQDAGWYMYFDKESENNNVDWFNEFTYNEMEEQKTETQGRIGNILNNVSEYNEKISCILQKCSKETKKTIGKLKITNNAVAKLSQTRSLDIQGKDTVSNLEKIQSKLKEFSKLIGQLKKTSEDLYSTTFEFPKQELNTIDTEIESIRTSVSDLLTKMGKKQKNSHFGIPISYEK